MTHYAGMAKLLNERQKMLALLMSFHAVFNNPGIPNWAPLKAKTEQLLKEAGVLHDAK